MLNKQDKKCSSIYTSCIKINGIPILPPLLTPERRRELQGYKKAAVEIEKCLQNKKETKHSKNSTVASVCAANTEISQRSHYKTLEQQLSFYSDDQKNTKSSSVLVKEVPYKNQNSALTINIIEVSEFSDDGVRIFNDSSPSLQTSEVTLTSSLLHQKHDLNDEVDNNHSCISYESSLSQRPRIRSNSYTLEAPSPLLLSHFEKEHAEPNGVSTALNNSQIVSNGHSIIDLSKSTVPLKSSPRNQDGFLEESIDKTCIILNDNNINEIFQQNRTKTSSPNNFSKNKSEMLHILKENMEEQMRLESYHMLKERLLCEKQFPFNEENTINVSCVTVQNCYDKSNGNLSHVFEDCISNQNSFCLPRSNGETMNILSETGEELLIDLDEGYNRTKDFVSCESSFNENLSKTPSQQPVNSPVYQVHHVAVNYLVNNNTCSGELFLENNLLQINYAASKIGAAIRGYLVRRLLHTEKVRALTQTIKDALICAMELHADNIENINESDVELHRRLIQQVSAACNAFYDIFFTLTKKEQMAIIAQDRLRLKNEKLRKRPKSKTIKKANKI